MTPIEPADRYQQLLSDILDTYQQGQSRAHSAVNAAMVETYWQVGRHIVKFE